MDRRGFVKALLGAPLAAKAALPRLSRGPIEAPALRRDDGTPTPRPGNYADAIVHTGIGPMPFKGAAEGFGPPVMKSGRSA